MGSMYPKNIPFNVDGISTVQDAMNKVVLELSDSDDSDFTSMMGHLIKAQKKATVWRPLLARLNILEELIPKFHVNKGKDSFDLQELMAFVSTGFANANGEARAAAVKVTVAAFKEVVRVAYHD